MSGLKKYPICLIPHEGLKQEISLEEIIPREREKICHVARRSKHPIKYCQLGDGTSIIENLDECIPNHEVGRGLSMNIIQEDVNEVLFCYQRDSPCWEGNNPNILEEKKYLSFQDVHYMIYNAISLFSEMTDDVEGNAEDISINEVEIALKDIVDDNDYYCAKLLHRPTKMNYWHFEFTILDNDQRPIPYKKNQRGKLLFNKIRTTHLLSCIEFNPAVNIGYSKYIKKDDITEELFLQHKQTICVAAENLTCQCVGNEN